MASFDPKDQLQAYRRWEAVSFDQPAPSPPTTPATDEAAPLQPAVPPRPFEETPLNAIPLPTAEDIERIENDAHVAGYTRGHEEGHAAGLAEIATTAARIGAFADQLTRALGEFDQQVGEHVLALALEVASQVMRSSIKAQPELILPIIREALAALPLHHGPVVMHINPDDGATVREHLGDQFAQGGWHIVEDRDITAGGCYITAGSSEIDAAVETRWQRVLDAIGCTSEWLEGRQP
jgi:flagellar assembly protein FliH